MQSVGLPLLLHGEVTSSDIDMFDREAVFIESILKPLIDKMPSLRIVLEHITTKQAAEFVINAPDHIGATLTPQHMLYNRNTMFQGGIRPHYYCLPILKRENHREALVAAATSGNKKFFLGTDSAPHVTGAKEASCGCAGIYSAHAAIEFYAEAFEKANALDKLEAFASHFGPDFYGLPRNTETITLVKEKHTVPATHPGGVTPLRANETLSWKMR